MKIAFNPSTVAALTSPPDNKDITFDLRGRNIFARGVKFCGTDTNTWRDIKINNVSIGSHTLDLRNGSNTTLTNINGVVTINSTWRPVVDNLTSDSTTSSLSANLGRILKALIDGKSDSDHNHDDRYLRLTGGWMSGDINFGGDNKIYWGRNTDSASISFKNDGDGDADSYMSFVTSDNGNEYFRWSHSSGSTNTEWMALRSDGLRVGGTKVSLEGHSHNDLYYTKTEVNNKLNGKSDIDHTHDDRYLKLTGGTMTGIIRATNRGGYWISGRDHCLIRSDDKTSSSYWSAILAIATVNGYWTLGHLGDGGERIGFNYDTDADYNAGRNNNHVIWLPTGGAEGTLALTSDIPTSLKNPYALTISLNGASQGPYDGSAAKNINITPGSIGAAVSNHSHDYLVVNAADDKSFNSAYHNFLVLYAGGGNGITGRPPGVDAFGLIKLRAAYGWSGQMLLANGGSLYIRSSEDALMTNTLAWKTILDSSNYSGILDSRYYTESEVNNLLDAKLNRQNLSYGTWNPRGYNLAADYSYNGGDLSISESVGLIHVSVDGYFWLNEGRYRVLDTSDIGGIRNSITILLYLSNSDTNWYPLIWGGDDHRNTYTSTGGIYKSHDVLSWLTSSLTLYATNIQTNNIKNLAIGGGIYWNPFAESTTDSTDAASITLVKSGVAGGTTLVLSLMNDANDTILFKTNGSARLYHNSYPILTTLNTYVSNNKGYINGTEITLVNNATTLDGAHLIRYGSGTGIKQVYYFNAQGNNASYIKLGTLNTVEVTGFSTSKVMFTVKGGINFGGTNESVYEVAASTRGSIQVTSTLVRGNRELKFGYVSTSSNVEIWMAYDGTFRGVTEVEISSSVSFTLAMTETTTKPSGFVEGSYRILAATTDNVASATKLQTPRTIWGQRFDGTRDVSGTLSGVANILFSADGAYDIGSNSAASRYIYTNWLGAKSGLKLELGANNSEYGKGLCIDTNLNVGIGTNTPAYKLHVNGAGHFTDYVNIPTLRIYGTSDNMSWNRGPGRIIFAENTSDDLALSLVYTSYDSVRSPAGIKLTGNLGNEWFEAPRIIKTGSSNSYVLLGGGGHKALSDFASSSHSHNYAVNENYGGFTKSGRLPISGFYQSNESESGGNAPWSSWMHLINCLHSNTNNNYALQIAASFYDNNTFKIRVTSYNVNNAWRDIIHSGNIGSQSVNYANSAGNADTVDGYHATDGRTFNGNINWSPNWNDTWSDGANKHPWYGFDHRYPNTGAYSTTITDYFGMTIKTANTLRLDCRDLLINGTNISNLNVASATKLQTPRSIWGQSFDGTGDVNGTIYINNNNSSNGAIRLNNNINSNARISAIDSQVIFNTGNAIRFGETAWDWNQWAGLKYTHSNKTIYLGIADNSVFNANSTLSGGTLNLRAGISNIHLNSGTSIIGLPTNGSPYSSRVTLNDTSISLSAYGDISMSTGPGVIELNSGYGGIKLSCLGNNASIDSGGFKVEASRGAYLNSGNSGNVWLCLGGGNVSIGYSSPSYKLDVNGLMRASGFHHSSMDSDNYMLLAGGGYKSFGGDDSNPIFLGYLNLDHGNDGTVSSSFYCLGYSVPFTYTRGGNYCRIYIPDTTHQVFYIKAAIASVHYSGGGMDTWVGDHRSAGAWWLHCYALSANEVRVKGFRNANSNNDSWWGGNPLYSNNDGANRITVCIFGYVTFR